MWRENSGKVTVPPRDSSKINEIKYDIVSKIMFCIYI